MIAAAVTAAPALAAFAELTPMHERQRVVAVVGAAAVALVVFELVRRRKLREEYSWVWVATAGAVGLLALNQPLLLALTRSIGAASSASTLFFGAIVFLLALCVQFSIRLSRLTLRQRTLAQRMALLEEELRELRRRRREEQPRDRAETGRRRATGQDEVA
ncbi:MAG: DUF2304 domain-containing protein [Planctomycetota bacterium]